METTVINDLAEEIGDEVVKWRRHLHRNPELSFEEEETSRFVYETLESFGGLELSKPTETSVLARLVGKESGRTIAFRADMDALPISEETGLEFASKKDSVMHACGHDGHTAILLGAAKVLSGMKDEIKGDIHFIFQHAEEKRPGGAQELVEAGAMEGIDAVVGLHLATFLDAGKVGIHHGAALPASDIFEIVVEGEGGHAAWPHRALDSVATAARVVTDLQHIVAREIDPLESVVLTATKIAGGSANNVIPDSVEIAGTVRTFDEEVRENVAEAMERIVAGVTAAHGASYSFEYRRGYLPVVNDEQVITAIEETVREVFGVETLEIMRPFMAADDFSAYQQVVPGAYFFVGARNEEKGTTYPHQHPRFDIDEDALEMGMKMFVHAAFRLLDTRPKTGRNPDRESA